METITTSQTLELTPFQLSVLSQLIKTRQTTQADEVEFVALCLKAAGKEIEKDTPIKLDNGKLVW